MCGVMCYVCTCGLVMYWHEASNYELWRGGLRASNIEKKHLSPLQFPNALSSNSELESSLVLFMLDHL